MEKFKTLNNGRCKDIINLAAVGKSRQAYILLYNSVELLTDELFKRVFAFCNEIAPLLVVFKTLPFNVQNYYNQLWLRKELL